MAARNYGTGPCFLYIKVPQPKDAAGAEAGAGGARRRGLIGSILDGAGLHPGDNIRHSPPVNRPLYLGVCRNWPVISNIPSWEDIFADSDGRRSPADVAYDGQTAIISCLMTEYDDTVASIVRQYQYPHGIAGTDNEFTRGNFMNGSQSWLELWVRWPNTDSAANSVLLHEPGRHYPYCHVQVDDIPEMGTSPMAIQFTFRAVAMRRHRRVIQTPTMYRFNESVTGGRASGEGRRLQIDLNRKTNYWFLWDYAGFETLPPPTREVAKRFNLRDFFT